MLGAFFTAFIAEGLGVALGILILYIFNIQSKKIIGMLYGGTSGIMIALICFDILPKAVVASNKIILFLGVTAGILCGLLMEEWTHSMSETINPNGSATLNTGIMLLLGIALHNIPEGFALGTILATSPESAMKFASVICLHSIPEAIAIAIPMKFARVSIKTITSTPIVLGAVMGGGAILGYLLSKIASEIIGFVLGGAGGVILYIVCNELLPESRKIWNGRMTTIATILGIVVGMFIITH